MSRSIPIQNIYYLLCYAWDKLDQGELVSIDPENCKTLPDLFAKVLTIGTKRIVKRGLQREYIEEVSETPSLRGRIAFTPSIRNLSWTKGRMVCEYTELSYDTISNRILKTTLRNLLFTVGLSAENKEVISGVLHTLHEITPVRIDSRIFRRIQYNQNMRFYRFLMNVCEIVYESIIPTQDAGESKFRDFIQDEQKMPNLFESFVFNFYKSETTLKVKSSSFAWQDLEGPDDAIALFPTMNTDVELRENGNLIILDCKYYLNAFTNNYDVERFKTVNLYQIYSYIKNRAIKEPDANVSGILLYPVTNKPFYHHVKLQGHSITMASIDLNQSWQKIAQELKSLPKFS